MGLDCINDYYDVRLKHGRLNRDGIDVSSIEYGKVVFSKAHPNLRFIKLKLEAKVKLLKSTRDIQAAMILGDIVVMPSLTPEPFGRVILEAQALGKIPIAFDHGGASETIIDGKNGFLAKPIDVDSLSKKISLALSLKGSKMEKIGEFAKKNVSKNFSHDKMCKLTLSLYKRCLTEYKR